MPAAVPSATGGLTLAARVAVRDPHVDTNASCPDSEAALGAAYADIVVPSANMSAHTDYDTTAATNTATAAARQIALEDIDMLSTNTVWMAQFGTSGAAGAVAAVTTAFLF